MGTSNHRVEIIRIQELEKHPNADRLSIVRVGGYQVVVRTEDWAVGDLAVYIQPDSVVPQIEQFAFLWENLTFPDGIVPEKKRRITARRFRKEWSEGLLIKVPTNITWVDEHGQDRNPVGEDIASVLGITHYEPPEDIGNLSGDNEVGPGSKQNKFWPRSLKGWMYFLVRVLTFGLYDPNGATGGANAAAPKAFRPIYDVEAYKNFKDVLQLGEAVQATEKIHGSNARYTFAGGKMYAGSRKLWKSPKSGCIWRRVLEQHPWIEQWCREHPDYTLYGEVVPTQSGFNYGCANGQTKFFVFDILNPEGQWVQGVDFKMEMGLVSRVPSLYVGFFDESVKQLADGPSMVEGTEHIREGVVIRPLVERDARNLGRVQLKIVSNAFLEKDSQ